MAQQWRDRLAVCRHGHIGVVKEKKVIKTINGATVIVRYIGFHLLDPLRNWQSEDVRFISRKGSDVLLWLSAGMFNEEDVYETR